MVDVFEIATIALRPRGRIGISRLPGLKGNFNRDLQTIFQWHPSTVVSMTELHEMREAKADGLGEALKLHNVSWLHLPLRDYGGLAGVNAKSWDENSAQLHSELNIGEGILVHCSGGHGRSGMIALRLLVERGVDPYVALKLLRAAKPGAVETEDQLSWASSISASSASNS